MTWISILVSAVRPHARRIGRGRFALAAVLCLGLAMSAAGLAAGGQAASARELYQQAQASDREARSALAQSSARSDAALSLVRAAVRAYRTVVLRHPSSGYCDDALWYGSQIGAAGFARFGHQRDREAVVALLKWLQSEYPGSPFVARAKPMLALLVAQAAPGPTTARSPAAAAPTTLHTEASVPVPADAAATRRVTSASAAPALPTVLSTAPPVLSATPPAAPATNGRGGYSIARQLGLRVGRVVIDPGHGGSDPGAMIPGLSESAITLDIALKLEALLTPSAGVDVELTRRTDVFVGLQERTAIANRDSADLFVSIHVNANRDHSIKGIETFLLNFASTPSAAAVAARENAGSTATMSQLDSVVKQIALTNKVQESRDLAAQLQASMVKRLRATDKGLRDLGVKQAPFVVLIGASMPSVLVEIAFLTHPVEGQLLATDAYRQRIAEALLEGVTRYLRSLKKSDVVPSAPSVDPPAGRPR
ncbi:MAG: N-acetylmuramoyl-L-alanine amidase [Acidobacteriota bacterium]